jgi:hypothetical protein
MNVYEFLVGKIHRFDGEPDDAAGIRTAPQLRTEPSGRCRDPPAWETWQ